MANAKNRGKVAKRGLPKNVEEVVSGGRHMFIVRVRRKGHDEREKYEYDPHQKNPKHDAHRERVLERVADRATYLRRLIDGGSYIPQDRANDDSLADWIPNWVRKYAPPRKTGDQYAATLERLLELSADHPQGGMDVMRMPVGLLQPEHFYTPSGGGLLNELKGGNLYQRHRPPATSATIQRHQAVLSTLWKDSTKEFKLKLENPFREFAVAKKDGEKQSHGKVMTPAQWEALTAIVARRPDTDAVQLAAVEFLRWTSCRVSEACKLRWEDVSLPEKVILIRDVKHPKTGVVRNKEIIMTEEIEAALRRVTPADTPEGELPQSGWVFPRRKPIPLKVKPGKRPPLPHLNRSRVRDLFNTLQKEMVAQGILKPGEHFRVHDLRHTRATEMGAGLEMALAMKQTGHQDPRTFLNTYVHTPSTGAEQLNALNKKVRNAGKGQAQLPSDSMVDISSLDENTKSLLLRFLEAGQKKD